MNAIFDYSYSLLVGLLAIVVLVVLLNLSALSRVAVLWITWYRNVMYLRSLPCPPRHWFWGHLLKVSTFFVSSYDQSDCKPRCKL